ncbi:MAG: histidine kinase [Chitinophagaceae bacterium]|nr:histidine kinase [Chitinophagaceae bacterium]MCW5927738.1 histidine kinase [Chitinophagaceae bacterium]
MHINAHYTSSESWWIRYKLYHIPFWFVYHCTWWSVSVGDPLIIFHSAFSTPYAIKNTFYVIFQALGVYFNLYYLIPRYLEKGDFLRYIFLVVLTIVVCAACIVPGYYVSSWLSGKPFEELYGVDPADYFHFFRANTLASSAASMTLAMSVKLTKNWIQAKRREQLLEKEKLETELTFLKYQFNPHFLFNTINSIFVLIHKNPDVASASLAKFSQLLRHQLYESNEKLIPLSREINYLENFIELEKLRQNDQTEVQVTIEKELADTYAIAPFILMTFVENAFKHVSRQTEASNWICIYLGMQEGNWKFSVVNSVSPLPTVQAIKYNGIGLQNVRRRLDLIYPGRYRLDIEKNDVFFKAELLLKLEGWEYHAETQTGSLPEKHLIST